MERLHHVDLFSGIGGIALAAGWAGFRTSLFCEIEPYCCHVLSKHWPGVPIHGDIRTLTREAISGYGIEASSVSLLTGGFPCQPFSTAGKRKGKEDHRHLWPAMLGVVRELRPAWVVGENVAGLVRMALDDVLTDLEGEDYACRAFLVPACGIGAPHRRERCFVVARLRNATHTQSVRVDSRVPEKSVPLQPGRVDRRTRGHWRNEPGVGRVANGVPSRVDRLRGLGNAVVPQQIYPILKGIADLESSTMLDEAAK